jgi:hypothetical protein
MLALLQLISDIAQRTPGLKNTAVPIIDAPSIFLARFIIELNLLLNSEKVSEDFCRLLTASGFW